MPLLAVLSLGASPGEMRVLRAVNFAPYLLSLPVGVLVGSHPPPTAADRRRPAARFIAGVHSTGGHAGRPGHATAVCGGRPERSAHARIRRGVHGLPARSGLVLETKGRPTRGSS